VVPKGKGSAVVSASHGKVKRTFYLELAAALALSEIQTEEFRRTGKKPDLSTLVSRAIRKLREAGG
jgi:hypothetical protein